MPPYFKVPYETLKSKGKTSLWMFSGIGIIVIVVASVVISQQIRKERNAKLILSPESGQILEVKTQNGNYSLWKVQAVHRDSVFFRPHHLETNSEDGIDELRWQRDTAYSAEIFIITTTQLKQMFGKGDVLNIYR